MRGKWSENYVGFTTFSRHNPMMSPRKTRLPDDRGEGGGVTCVHTAQTLVLHNCHTDGAKTHRDENLFGKEKETIHSRETANRAVIRTRQCAKPSENCFVFGSPYINNQLISFARGREKKKKKPSKLDMQMAPADAKVVASLASEATA